MAKHADLQGVPDTPDEWLEQFGTYSIYQVLPEIIELWGLNVQLGVHISEMDLPTIGTINEVYSEM